MEGSVLKKREEVRSKDNAENLMFLFPSESPPDHKISSWTALSFMDFCFCFSNDSDIPIRKKLPRKSTFRQRPSHRLGTHNWATLTCLVSICLQLCFYHVIPNNWRCWLLTPVSKCVCWEHSGLNRKPTEGNAEVFVLCSGKTQPAT